MSSIIIAGFPGVGKSTAAKHNHADFVDMESSIYHWDFDDNGNRIPDTNWPNNYVDAIQKNFEFFNVVEYGGRKKITFILTSTHNEVLGEMKKRNLPFFIVAPSKKDKKFYLDTYKKRGNSEEFINKLDKNFESFLEDLDSCEVPIFRMSNRFLEDVCNDRRIIDFISGYMYSKGYKIHDEII